MELIVEHERERWEKATEGNPKLEPSAVPIESEYANIRAVFNRATNLEALKFCHRLIGGFMNRREGDAKRDGYVRDLQSDYKQAWAQLENIPTSPAPFHRPVPGWTEPR